jgi:hypothetical protein
MTRITKSNLSENVNVNFNQSKEIAYWANKYNLTLDKFQQLFKEAGYSISRLLSSGVLDNNKVTA